ncbi:hypothetical protein D3C71_2144470 [compost metagenome]
MAAVGVIVGAVGSIHTFEQQRVAASVDGFARCQRDFMLHMQSFHQQRTDQEHSDAEVGDQHAPGVGI